MRAVADHHRMKYWPARLILLASMILVASGAAQAQVTLYPNFLQLERPGRLNATLFGGGYGSDKYGTIQEGFQLEQSITRYVGVVGRVSGYQLFIGEGFDDPLAPGSGHAARLNFARMQAGADFTLYPGTHLYLLGGGDAGDSHAAVVEGDFSSWLFMHSPHPVNFSFSSNYNDQNQVVSSGIDLRAVVLSTEKYMVLAGGGGAIYAGGFVSSIQGQGGPDLSVYLRKLGMGVDLQAGYGDAHQYGQASLYKTWGFRE